jgi:hypothetical protein
MAKKQEQLNILEKAHKNLANKSSLYAGWHTHPYQHQLQMVVLVMVLVIVGGLFILRGQNEHKLTAVPTQASNSELLAQQETKLNGQTKDLLDAIQEYKKASAEERPALLDSLVALAKERYDSLSLVAGDKPDALIRNALAGKFRADLPEEVAQYIEQESTRDGRFEWLVEEDAQSSRNRYSLVSGTNNRVELKFAESATFPAAKGGNKIRVRGYLVGSKFVVSQSKGSMQVLSATTPPVTKKVAVILFNFRDNAPAWNVPYTPEQARQTVFTGSSSANSFYQENSFGSLNLKGAIREDGDVFGWYTIPFAHNNNCPGNLYTNWIMAAETAARADGFIRANYTNIVYGFPQGQCGFQGVASLGDSINPDDNTVGPARAYINDNGIISYTPGMITYMPVGTVSHELGHNFYRMHASSYKCLDPNGAIVTISSNCTISSEQGDPFNVMGSTTGLKHMSSFHKGISMDPNANWLSSSNTFTIDRNANPNGIYSLNAIEQSTSGVQTLRIAHPYPSYAGQTIPGYLYIDFRQPYGYDNFAPTDPVVNGVTLHLGTSYDYSYSTPTQSGSYIANSLLLDATPNSAGGVWDSALPVGQTFTDSQYGITVRLVSISGGVANVQVSFSGATCQNTSPTLTITPTQANTTAGQTTSYTLTLKNNDSANCAPSNYNLSGLLPSGLTQTPPAWSETLAPGASVSRTILITADLNAAAGSYAITEKAVSATSSSLTAQAFVQLTVAGVDRTGPVVTISSPADGSELKGKGKFNIISAATDPSGVASIRLYVDTTLLQTCLNTTSCSVGSNLNNLRPGLHQVKAEAADMNGNVTTKVSSFSK